MRLKRRKNSVPTLQMAAMPDLIFTILFFFMIATHMRTNTAQVEFVKPQGTNLQKIASDYEVVDIYISRTGDIQLNNKVVALHALGTALRHLDSTKPLCASLQADAHTPMRTITKVKQELRKANILKINYSADHETIPRPTE